MYIQPDNSCVKSEYPRRHLTANRLEECTADWYVAYTQARQEEIAVANLQRQNFDTYLPLFKILKKHGKSTAINSSPPAKNTQITGATAHSSDAHPLLAFEPMFPRYVFFRPSRRGQSISTVRSTRGVHSVLMFGTNLAVIQHEVLQAIRHREHQRNQASTEIISPFQPGSHVRFRDPAFHSLDGLVQSVSAQRIVLLLEILGREKTVSVQHHQVELA